MSADVTVIMPAYQAAETIGRALGSIAAQSLPPAHVVVVDDGSADKTKEVAESYVGKMGGIALTVLGQKNLGPGAARNRALDEAKTNYVAFLDADDEWLPEKLERTLPLLDAFDLDFVSHDFISIDAGVETPIDCARHFLATNDPYGALFRRGYIATSTVIARRQAISAAGGFDETLRSGQDYELWLHMAGKAAARFRVVPGVWTRYYRVPGSVTSFVERRREAALRIAWRHTGQLRQVGQHPLRTALTRVGIIAYEAAGGHVYGKSRLGQLWAYIRLPANLIGMIMHFFTASSEQRP